MTEDFCVENSPRIRFAQYDNQWVSRPLSRIATMHARIGWQNLRTTEFLEDGDFLLVTGTDFIDGKINYDTCHYVEKIRYEQDKNIQIHDGSILVTKDGTLGKVAFVQALKHPATLNAGVFNVVVKNSSDSDPQYVYYYLRAPFLMKYVDKKAIGGTIKHLNQNILVDFPIMQPLLIDEQKKIGHLLRQIDEQVESETKKYESLLKFKQACLQRMFPKDGDYPGMRMKGFSKKWKWVKISSFCDISTGESNTQDQVPDGDYPFYIRSRNPVRSNRFLYDCEAVLTIGDGDIGKVFHYVNGKFDLHQRVYIMTNFVDVDAKYFYYAFSNSFYDRVISMSAKSTVDSVRRDMIADMMICIPEHDEQIQIRDYFTALDDLIMTQCNVIDCMKNIKNSLLQRLLI